MTKQWVIGADCTEEQWFKFNQKLKTLGFGPFVKETTRVYFVVSDVGKVAGFGVIQFIPHAEPIWVDKEFRGKGLAEEIATEVVGALDEVGVGFVALASNPFSAQLCEKHGMELLDVPVYVRKTPNG